ncbi:MAG: hypothetical protein HRU11_15215 [Parvularculaceae bacterium]|nr:hypothetical protein [Parvularculaceae bacterium]
MKRFIGAAAALLLGSQAHAVTVSWTDWQTSAGNTTATGVITVGTETVEVTWNGPQASFVQLSGGIDYWQNARSGRNAATSAYTSTGPNGNDNIPTGTDIIAQNFGGTNTLTFSKAITGLYFSYVSINGNTMTFDTDFEILSNTSFNIDGAGADNSGYWGSGAVTKNGTALTANGEAHGTLFFAGSLTQLVWTDVREAWHGFTIGIADVSADPVPVPAAALLFAPVVGLFAARKRRSR